MALGSIIAAGVFWALDRYSRAQLIYGVLLPQSLVVHLGYDDEPGYYTDHVLAPYRWIAMSLSLPVLAIIGCFTGFALLFVTFLVSIARHPWTALL